MNKSKVIVLDTRNQFSLVVGRKDGEAFDVSNVSRVVANYAGTVIDSSLSPGVIEWVNEGDSARITFTLVNEVPEGEHDLHLKIFTPIAPEGVSIIHRKFKQMNFRLKVVP